MTTEEYARITQGLMGVLLEDWGGPRSPLALRFIEETIIPNLTDCFAKNADLILNLTFTEIVAWKLRCQFAYPNAVVNSLAEDLLGVVKTLSLPPQKLEPKEPWRRIFRLWVSGESLLTIEERTGYPLDYLELLFLRWKKLKSFVTQRRANLLECLGDSELRAYGIEQVSFLYQFQHALATEPLYRERLVLEQVILELALPLQVSDLVSLLEIVHAHEGKITEATLATVLRGAGNSSVVKAYAETRPTAAFARIMDKLLHAYVLQKSKTGTLSLSEKSAATLAPFLVPKFYHQIQGALEVDDYERGKQILMGLNPEILVKVLQELVDKLSQAKVYPLLHGIFKQVSRRIDLYLLNLFGQFSEAFELFMTCLDDRDSLIRAKACEALGQLGDKNAAFCLIQMLLDPVPEVKEKAAQALGELGSVVGTKPLARVAEDLSENPNVRLQAREALRKLEARQLLRLNTTP